MEMSALFAKLLKESDPIDWETPATKDGCKVSRLFADTDRYIVDFADGFAADGWLQFDTDQDAHYFGAWVNPKQFLSMSYAEGDWTIVQCLDKERYNREVARMIEFYAEGRIALVIDRDGSATEIRQDRQEFFAV